MNERAFPGIRTRSGRRSRKDVFDEGRNGRPAQGYDRKLARALGTIDLSRQEPDLWPQFIALGQFPALRHCAARTPTC